MEYHGHDRRRSSISEEDMELIASKAAEKALQKVYADVGKGITHKLAWVLGSIFVALLMWLGAKGITLK